MTLFAPILSIYFSVILDQVQVSGKAVERLTCCVFPVTDDRKLQIFSLLDGSVVTSPASSYQYDTSISCVRFESGEWPVLGSHVPRLLVGTGQVVEEWTW